MMGIIKALKCCQNFTKLLYDHALGLFSNDDPGLTLTNFYDRVKLVPDASVWVTTYRALSVLVFPSLF